MKTKPIKDAKNKKMLICIFIFFGIFIFIQNAFAAVPIINPIANASINQGQTYVVIPVLSAGVNVKWSKEFGPDDMTVNSMTGEVSWAIPSDLPREAFHLGVRATNSDGSVYTTWILKVGGGNYVYVGAGETYTTISAGTSEASSGDTIVVRDGIYTGIANQLYNTGANRGTMPPSGSASTYTTIMAETPGNVFLDGQGACDMLKGYGNYDDRSDHDFGTYNLSYIAFKGFVVTGNATQSPVFMNHVHHIKFIDIGAYSTTIVTDDIGLIAMYRSAYMLVEGCYTWGRGRMQVIFYICDYSIMRRCVVRSEDSNAVNPFGVYDFYGCQYARGQDLIAIDGTGNAPNRTYQAGILIAHFGSLATPEMGKLIDNKYRNIIILNQTGFLMTISNAEWENDTVEIRNSIVWDIKLQTHNTAKTEATNLLTAAGKINVSYLTIGHINSPLAPVYRDNLFNGWNDNQSINNCIITRVRDYDNSPLGVFYDIEQADSNNIYDTGQILKYGSILPTNTVTADPFTNGLSYLPQIVPGSILENAGSGGTRIGAEILHFQGNSGTLFGELGFDDETTIPSWPWPNEDVIQHKMRSFPGTGARGFCTDGKQLNGIDDITLTSYIWEYLGNPIPPEIYGSSGIDSDLNSDGKVDITDVQACVNHFLGAQLNTKADVNSDGSVNVQDVQSIVNKILGN